MTKTNMTFEEFLAVAEYGFRCGIIKCSAVLSMYDMAVTFALDRLYDRKGKGCVVSVEEIYQEMCTFTIPDALPNDGWFYET